MKVEGQLSSTKRDVKELGDTYPLLLCGHEGLEARRHPEAQLMDKRGLRLAVDLNSHPSFKGRVLWERQSRQQKYLKG